VKRCSKCGEVKPLEDFYKNKSRKHGVSSLCKSCESAYRKQYLEQNREKTSAYQKQYRKQNRLSKYKKGAKLRNLEWLLTDEDALELFSEPCAYCGDSGGGIDRMDNTKGYTPDNCRPCCKTCNFMKLKMGVEEFVEQSVRIAICFYKKTQEAEWSTTLNA